MEAVFEKLIHFINIWHCYWPSLARFIPINQGTMNTNYSEKQRGTYYFPKKITFKYMHSDILKINYTIMQSKV